MAGYIGSKTSVTVTSPETDSRYVNAAGDTMTGALTLSGGISDGTTTLGTGYVVNGSAKAWVNFNGTGTIAARDSLNVSSLTDNGTGSYTVNWSNAFNAADYAFNISSGATNYRVNGASVVAGEGAITTQDSAYNLADSAYVYAASHGDLA